jgi:hypothetical protein
VQRAEAAGPPDVGGALARAGLLLRRQPCMSR